MKMVPNLNALFAALPTHSPTVAVLPVPLQATVTPATLNFNATDLRQRLENFHFATDGDTHERQYWPVLNEHFPSMEIFWQQIVVLTTNRIDDAVHAAQRIARRPGIAEDIWRICYLNYSLFLHLASASDHLAFPVQSSFGDFYTHLGSACDLAEELLLSVHLCERECASTPVPVMQGLSKQDFLEIAGKWYDTEYPKAHAHYLSKGKSKGLYLPPRMKILDGFFPAGDTAWKAYTKFADLIRRYRNKVVHDVAIGNIVVGKIYLVPKKEQIQNYARLIDIQEVANDVPRLKRDFAVREKQMYSDFAMFQQRLNGVWLKPIATISRLLFDDRNPLLLRKYNLTLA